MLYSSEHLNIFPVNYWCPSIIHSVLDIACGSQSCQTQLGFLHSFLVKRNDINQFTALSERIHSTIMYSTIVIFLNVTPTTLIVLLNNSGVSQQTPACDTWSRVVMSVVLSLDDVSWHDIDHGHDFMSKLDHLHVNLSSLKHSTCLARILKLFLNL